jgi:hypothetical protein
LYYDLASSPADDGNIDCDDSEYGLILPSSFPSVLPTTDSLTFSEPVSVDVVQEKRHVSSARETRLLQRSGIEQIRNLANDLQVPPPNGLPSIKNSRGLPKVYGFVEHYHFTDLWGATLMKQHCRNGTSTSVSASSSSEAVGMNTVFQLPKTRSRPKLLVRVHLLKYDFDKRLDDQVIWPRPNTKKFGIKKFASHFLTL